MNLESLLHRRKNSSLTASALVAILGATWLPQSVAEGLSLEEVVVTAQKRAESLQDVPIAVTAISGDKIADAGIQGLEDMSSYVPNLKITSATGQSAGFIVIRGVGSGNNSGFEQSVGMFIDGIYAGRSRQFMVPFLDLAAVEVLKGPQGTLFGKNTVAGAISIQSAKPTNTLEGNVRLSYETEYDSKEASAVVSGPLTDYLSGRLAVKHNDKSGTVENLIRGTEEPTSDSQAIRGSLLFDVSDNIQVLSKLEYANVYNEGSIFQLSGIDGIWASPLGEYIHVDEVSPIEDGKLDNKNTLDSPNKEFVETTSINGLIKVDWDLENFSLTSITGYSDYESEVLADADFSDILFIETNPAETFDQTSQEFRLTSQGGGDLDFIVGLYLETQQWDRAIETLGTALADPEYRQPSKARHNLGWAYYNKGQYAEARGEYQKVLREFPLFCPAVRNLGMVDEAEGKLRDAMVRYKQAQQCDPTDLNVRLSLGTIEARLDLRGDACGNLITVRDADPYGELATEAGRLIAQLECEGPASR